MVRRAWFRPNTILAGDGWRSVNKVKKGIQADVNKAALGAWVDGGAVLNRTPEHRWARFTIVTRRGPHPEGDDAISGLAMLQDCLARVRLRPGRDGPIKVLDGAGFIWDSSPEWLTILPVKLETESKLCPGGQRFVIVEIWKEDPGA